ncbi:MAG: DNA mismatch repair endonuclease MutL [Planctomycetes bacterium]|nr:DNA mismatch repair endonuclease MutL [Planctomycetota bacterium]
MARIQLLPPELANKIAAGEVVERPASVVKELVENALDAGATRVDVQLVDAGKTLIRVADNGAGMDAADLALAFEPHATSKLTSVEQLFHVLTHGFRGEALASIQSVSRARLTTRTGTAQAALELESSGGELGEIRETAGAPGTVVEIRDLFFNVPARRRWLKGDSTEFSHVVELMQAIAAANPEVGFSLTHGSRKAFDVPEGQNQSDRVRDLYGDRFREGMLEIHEYEPYGRLDGFVAPPAMHRPNSKGLLLFANRRPIKDRSLIQAVILAYREFLPPGRYPVAVLFLTVEPDSIDVNVHPAKTEVRFMEHNRLFSLVKSALTEKLINSGVLPAIKLHGPALPQARPDSPFEPTFDVSQHRLFDSQSEQRARDAEHRWQDARRVLDEAMGPAISRFEVRAASAGPEPAATAKSEEISRQTPDTGLLAQAKALFQVGATYIVVEVADGMVVIDQHAYHERILYWLLENRISAQPMERQRLLVPQPLELSIAAADLAGAHLDALKEFGFELEAFGHGAWALRAVPKYSVGGKHLEVVQEILEELAQGRKPNTPQEMRKSMVESVACHAAIKAGDVLEPQQIKNLLLLGETVPHTFSCPHGRPTTYKLGFTDLEKIFHRR